MHSEMAPTRFRLFCLPHGAPFTYPIDKFIPEQMKKLLLLGKEWRMSQAWREDLLAIPETSSRLFHTPL